MKSIRTTPEFALLANFSVVLDLLTLMDKYDICTILVIIKRNTEIVELNNIIVTSLLKQNIGCLE